MVVVRLLIGAVLAGVLAWLFLLLALAMLRPAGISFGDAKRMVPDIVRLIRALAKDPDLPKGVRRRLAFLLGYLALPIDLIPDFVPILGYADDVIVLAVVLRSVVRLAGPAALDRHWKGTPEGLAFVRRLSGIT